MNFECPQCNTPLARSGQRFCNRCGTDVTAYYESRGVILPDSSGESDSAAVNVSPEEMQTLEIQLSTPADDKAKPSGSHTVAFDMSEITQAAPPLDASAPQKAMLRIVLPSSDVFDRELKKLETQIGKGPRNDIVIADPAVSTSHAVLRAENGGYSITDIGSRNGTSVNGKRITTTEKLNHGDVIGMGVTKLTFRFADYSETGVIQMPDITAITQSAPLPLTEDSLAYALVGENLLSQMQIGTLRGSGARGRRLYRAIVEEKLVSEEKLRDLMSRVFHMQTTNLRDAQIDETLTAKFPIKLAQEAWVFPVLETAQQLTLAVADPTNSQAINEVKGRVNPNIEFRLATASEIIEQTERHYGPKLVGVLPSGDKIEYSLNRHETEIGKAAHNHIVLTDPTVSNTHAIILNRDGGYSIVDLGSRNGTFLNGERLTTHARTLKHGDTIQMGQTVWTFRNALQTPENVTAILSPQALEEVRRRAGFGNSANQPAELGAATPPAFPLANQALNVAPATQDASGLPIPGGVLVAPAAVSPDDDGGEKKKKKKIKENQEKERIKAAYIRAIGGILATVMSAVLTVVLTITVMRSGNQSGGSTTNKSALELTPKGHPKLKINPPPPGTAFQGGNFEASGAIQVPNTDGVYFVDNGKPKEIFWMPLDQSGKQSGAIKPIVFGAEVEDPESIAYGGSFFYVMSSLSNSEAGDKNCLLRFALDPLTQNLQGQPEVMTGIRQFLVDNVAALKPIAGLAYNEGGINIEGMAWDAVHDRLLLGFRSPTVNGNALLVPIRLRDPRGTFSTQNLITEPVIQIPLGGLGIRDIEYDSRSGAFLIIAGSTAQGDVKDFVLYEWTGETDSSKPDAAPIELANLDAKMKPEGVTRVKIGGRDFLIVTGDASSYIKLDILE
jgi:pSer/pThr/pTyr-binding forkhead associated (FHA) protein